MSDTFQITSIEEWGQSWNLAVMCKCKAVFFQKIYVTKSNDGSYKTDITAKNHLIREFIVDVVLYESLEQIDGKTKWQLHMGTKDAPYCQDTIHNWDGYLSREQADNQIKPQLKAFFNRPLGDIMDHTAEKYDVGVVR